MRDIPWLWVGVGILLAMFVIPMVAGLVSGLINPPKKAQGQ